MNKDFIELVKYLIPAIVAVIGWAIAHYYNSKRDKSNKKRELVIQHLINAYRVLTNDISHRKQTPDREKKLEEIITEIQLFGSINQAKMAKQLAEEVKNKQDFQLDPLINSLRSDLRKQLELEEINSNVTWLRFENT